MKHKRKRKINYTTRNMCLIALLSALSIVLDIISIRNDFTKITLYALPLILASLLFHPFIGVCAGLVTGFISQVICYGITPTTILWMIPYILWGAIPGILANKLNVVNKEHLYFPILVSAFLITCINSIILYLDGAIMGYTVSYTLTLIIVRFLLSFISSIAYYFIIFIVFDRLKKIIGKK